MKRVKRRALAAAILLTALWAVTATCLLTRSAVTRAMPAHSAAVTAEAEDPVTRFRTEREQLRQRQISQLNEIIYSSSDASIVAEAQRQLLSLTRSQEAELTLEGVLEARGFDKPLATVHDNSVNILLRTPGLTQRETAVIMELVLRETGVTGGNVKIIPIN